MNYVTDITIIVALLIAAVGVFYLIRYPKRKSKNSIDDATSEFPVDGFENDNHHSPED